MNEAASVTAGTTDTKSGHVEEPNYPALSDLNPYLKHHHDINNALLGILGFVELLQLADDPLTEDQRDCLDHIKDCAETITKRARSLLSMQMNLFDEKDID